ncbi:zinc finger and SCAN domain-containing protein 2-like [Epinephelus fuscoguttatus]|uniref:zinc finger and SCAN domain-containing protein 2-like n=1 Tax=Epinephelus fuscoguttatus TaxID=293821 RepID=UPI0020D0997A|nr:zinc finger and SCAN domain-containing protein 2-like [Epinephelus fuscoguttatus]
MSSVQYLRGFINERLTAAAEEIFGVIEKTIVEYEEEIDRQRRLLDIAWKPEIKLHRIVPPELPQQHVCKEEEVVAEQQLCVQERNSSVEQEEPKPPEIKEEEEELCSSQEGEQLEVKQETDDFMLTPTNEESDHSEDQTVNLRISETQNMVKEMPLRYISDKSHVVPEPDSDHQLLSHEAESQDQKGDKHGDSGSTRNAEQTEPNHNSNSHTNNSYNPTISTIHYNTDTGKKSLNCDTCGKAFTCRSLFQRHLRAHTGEKPYSCNICGKKFTQTSGLNAHRRTHTGEKPFICKTCGKEFAFSSPLTVHMRTHTGEKPYSCNICGKKFNQKSVLNNHRRTHTGEKPYCCKTCGKDFRTRGNFIEHTRIHTGERPYSCKTCGKDFGRKTDLNVHMRIHTGEKPHSCSTMEKKLLDNRIEISCKNPYR